MTDDPQLITLSAKNMWFLKLHKCIFLLIKEVFYSSWRNLADQVMMDVVTVFNKRFLDRYWFIFMDNWPSFLRSGML